VNQRSQSAIGFQVHSFPGLDADIEDED